MPGGVLSQLWKETETQCTPHRAIASHGKSFPPYQGVAGNTFYLPASARAQTLMSTKCCMPILPVSLSSVPQPTVSRNVGAPRP